MRLGVTGSTDIKQFNPVLYFQVKEPNFRRFCIENGFGECKVSEIITGTAGGVEESARDWAMMLQFSLQTISADTEDARWVCQKEIVEECDVLLICSDNPPTGSAELLNYARKQKKPVYQINEQTNL